MYRVASIAFLFFTVFPAWAADSNGDVLLLDVPFVVQAPLGSWDWPWQDFCEEASVVMAYAYTMNTPVGNLQGALMMLESAIFELKTFGYEKDTNVFETERVLREHFRYEKTRIIENPSVSVMKAEVKKGNVLLVPVAGRMLGNPYFVQPGPRYHMVLVRGFTASHFIVNEPGTKNGAGYRYPITVLMNAMHDLVPGNITEGRKAILVVEK
ncbi:MAG: hypothetical protein HY471_00895 [Candidatus Sungbacteria bacterium]|nr:hypothetical protein [Candidatus Sungbacteria bacterium]